MIVAKDLARVADVIAARGLPLGQPLVVQAETGSTNDDAKAGARAGARHGATWVAESQTAGRGRQGRSWLSEPGENLLFSVLMRQQCAPARVPLLSLAAGLAVRDAVAKAIGRDEDVRVKWPNDVQVAGKKISGILVESALAGPNVEYVVVGIGLNVHARSLPAELAAMATSLALETQAPLDRAEVLADILEGLARDLTLVADRGLAPIHARLSARDALAGREVESTDGDLRGTAAGIDPDGRLLLRKPDGTLVRISSGEVRLRVIQER